MLRDANRSNLSLMFKSARTILTGTPLVVLPTLAADAEVQTGITSVGPAVFIFTLAGALLLTLVFRSTANHLTRFRYRPDRPVANQSGA